MAHRVRRRRRHQVEGRTSAATIAWLNAQPEPWRDGITHVAIDLSAAYAKAVREALPAALLVADRFHVGALATDMLTQVRQRVIPETQGRRGRKTDPAWANRRRLLTAHERLRPETFARMWSSLIDTGDPGVQILQAYVVKEELRALLNLSGTNPGRHLIRTRLDSFYQQAAATDAPEAHRLAKHQGRNAFGFRNPVNQRRRLRWSCTRQHGRASAARSTLPG